MSLLEELGLRPAKEKWPPGLFLDGVKQVAVGAGKPAAFELGIVDPDIVLDYYSIPVGKFNLEFYLCPESCVEIDSERFLTLQKDLDKDVVDNEYCRVVFVDTVSQRCTFEGECTLVNVIIAESHLSASILILRDVDEKMFNIYIRLELLESEVIDGRFSKDAVVMGSTLQDVTVISRTDNTVLVDQCDMQFSKFNTDGQILLEDVYAWNTHVNMHGLLTIQRVNWPKVRITGESIHVPGPMYFLEVVLPKVKFYVYQTGGCKWAIAPDIRGDRFSVFVDNPNVEDMLQQVLRDRRQGSEESCLQYIYDSIESRTKVMTAIERYRHQEYLRLSAVC